MVFRSPAHFPHPCEFKRVLLLRDQDCVGGRALFDALREHGCAVEVIYRSALQTHINQIDLTDFDLVFGYGPHNGSMVPTVEWLLSVREKPQRPVFVWWLMENLPNPQMPRWLVELGAEIRVALDRWYERPGWLQQTLNRFRLQKLLLAGHRFRTLGGLHWARTHGILDVLAVAGDERSRFLRQYGFLPHTIFLGYHPLFGRDLNITRDVDVVFLGIPGSRRRQKILRQLQRELRSRNISLVVADGRNGYLDGERRTQYLNRCKIFLNILKAPHDAIAYRLHMGAANKTLVVSEPLMELSGFEPGRHFAMVPIEKIAETIEYYLIHEEERHVMTDEAYWFVTQEFTIGQTVGQILQQCRAITDPTYTREHFDKTRLIQEPLAFHNS